VPIVDLHEKIVECIRSLVRLMQPHYDIGGRLMRCFEDAGLPTPQLMGSDRWRPRLAALAMACYELSRVDAAGCKHGFGARRPWRSGDHRRAVDWPGKSPSCADCFRTAVLRLGHST
jgi:hypothetical protein